MSVRLPYQSKIVPAPPRVPDYRGTKTIPGTSVIAAALHWYTNRLAIGNDSALIQLAQFRFPGLAVSNAKILIYFSEKIYISNFIKQNSETVIV